MQSGWLRLVIAAMLTASNPVAAQDDLPPVGRSRFDQLIGNAPVPQPFSRLVALITRQMQVDADGLPPLKVTLIPLGRSLQREAGAPDYFRFPRVVAAADGDNKPGIAPLKDRLFLGYHEIGGVVEVISYNDAAGRFEFQVVRDYQVGKTATVLYARRSVCLACHQNAAPIFARPLWDETPANPAIAQRLRASRQDFYGIKPGGTDIAYFIDTATDRANLFSVWQRLWQQGCGNGDAGDRCRLEAFAAALEYARNGKLPAQPVLSTLARNWQSRWPNGLPIPNPDLPNRDPLAALPDPGHDPLLLRPLREIWFAPDTTGFIVGLAGMLDRSAVRQLQQADLAAPLERLRARGVLTAGPFNHALLQALLAELGRPVRTAHIRLPPARADTVKPVADSSAIFRIHCASCHDTTLQHPPNFLHGSSAQVEANLNQCAPRIVVRLSMAGKAPAGHRVAPMPPGSALSSRGITPRQWEKSAELAALKRSIASRLPQVTTASLLQQPYDRLPPCLPADGQTAPPYAERTP